MSKPSLNKFLRECIAARANFSRITIVRISGGVHWNNYFPKGVPVTFRKGGGNEFYVSTTKTQWVCTESAGDCEIISAHLTGKGVVINIGEGCHD